ncbi:hypothetical protein T440DRAFT_514264 [Plenodomus tracheiphilus IPT5]|uniref:Uncharacterized protein n=1 Tax=Plenodomus tracheiphilus IPT5 TaxID=1408161 RepID=A0A6A7BIB0_9PLEO|nr:hypothetical protein T440DRAFT_514264 [Plenodomus tracheiphilus IPT5]
MYLKPRGGNRYRIETTLGYRRRANTRGGRNSNAWSGWTLISATIYQHRSILRRYQFSYISPLSSQAIPSVCMAYASNPIGQHGGGYDPSSGAFVQIQSFPQGPKPHCGGGSFDPRLPYSEPSVTVQPLPVEKPNFNTTPPHNLQASTPYYPQPYQQPPQNNNAQPGFIAQLCACFR